MAKFRAPTRRYNGAPAHLIRGPPWSSRPLRFESLDAATPALEGEVPCLRCRPLRVIHRSVIPCLSPADVETRATVVITDTDHYAPGRGDALWAWKSFVRGHHPILMDFGIIDVVHHLDPSLGVPPCEAFEAAPRDERHAPRSRRRSARCRRYCIGDVRRILGPSRIAYSEPGGSNAGRKHHVGASLVRAGVE